MALVSVQLHETCLRNIQVYICMHSTWVCPGGPKFQGGAKVGKPLTQSSWWHTLLTVHREESRGLAVRQLGLSWAA